MVVNNSHEFEAQRASPEEDKGKEWPQILAICIACLGTLTCGMLFAWPSPFILVITKDKVNYDITEDEASYFTTIQPFGLIFASVAFFKLNNTIGRKGSLLLIAIPHIAFWIITMFARSVYVFYVARFIAGVGDAASIAALPMYIGEVATPKVRGAWGNLMVCSVFCGQFLINLLGSYLDVRRTAYVGIVVPVIFAMSFSLMPESPYFFIMKGKYDKAIDSLRRLRRKQNVDDEFNQMKADVERQMSESGTWKDLFTIRSNRKALYAGIFLRLFQQLAGMSVFTNYTQYIFEKSGSNFNPQTSAIIFTAMCFSLNFCAGFLLDKLGRKKAYVISSFTCAIVLFAEAAFFYIDQFYGNVDEYRWVPLAGMLLFIIFFSLGLGIVPTLMLSELFSTSIKEKGICCLAMVYGIFIFCTNYMFYWLNISVGLFSPFLLFSICCFISTFLSLYLVPETSGKTLEEIQQALKGNKNSKLTKDDKV